MDWKTMLAYVTGSVDEELLRRNEYLVAENRILRAQIPGRLKLTDGERRTLAHLGKQLGRKALARVATIRAARHDSGLAPAAGREEVRWLEEAKLSRPARGRSSR